MSELGFFQGGAAVAESTPGGSRTKLVAVIGGAVALVLVAIFVVLPMLSADSDATPVSRKVTRQAKGTVKAPGKTAAKPVAAAAKPAAKPAAVPATFNDTVGRDPFRALLTVPQPAAPNAPAPVYGAPVTGGNLGGAPASSSSIGGNRVALLDVFVRDGKTYAQTKVGDTVHTPQVGGTFAATYKLLSASGTCGTYLFGDETFSLCEGQEVLK